MKLGMHPAWTSWLRAGAAATVPVGSTGTLFQVAVEMSMNSMSETQYIQYSVTILGVCESLRCLAAWLLGSFSLSLPPLLAWPQQSDQPQNIYVEKTAVLVGLWAWTILLGAQLVVSWVDSYIPNWPTLKPFQRGSSGWNQKQHLYTASLEGGQLILEVQVSVLLSACARVIWQQEFIKSWLQRFTKDFQQIDPRRRSTSSWSMICVNFMGNTVSTWRRWNCSLAASVRGPSTSPMNKATTTEQESIKIQNKGKPYIILISTISPHILYPIHYTN